MTIKDQAALVARNQDLEKERDELRTTVGGLEHRIRCGNTAFANLQDVVKQRDAELTNVRALLASSEAHRAVAERERDKAWNAAEVMASAVDDLELKAESAMLALFPDCLEPNPTLSELRRECALRDLSPNLLAWSVEGVGVYDLDEESAASLLAFVRSKPLPPADDEEAEADETGFMTDTR